MACKEEFQVPENYYGNVSIVVAERDVWSNNEIIYSNEISYSVGDTFGFTDNLFVDISDVQDVGRREFFAYAIIDFQRINDAINQLEEMVYVGIWDNDVHVEVSTKLMRIKIKK